MSDLQSRFPDLLPMEEIRVGPETHTYEVIEYDDTPNAVKSQYVPNKAPVLEVENISGIVNGDEYSFDQGVDYEVIDTDNDGRLETIDFSVGGVSPDNNTEFEITYIARSIIVRYIESYEDEFDRVADDIEEVIDSHYVDEATNTGYIDDFEDEEIVEYDFLDGGDTNATVQSDTVLSNDWALELNSPSASSPVTIASSAGLPRYPVRGDTIIYYTQLTHTDDIGHFDFMWAENATGNDRYYRISIDANADEFRVQKNAGSVKQDTLSVSLDQYLGQWVRVEFEIQPVGTIEATLYNATGAEIGTVSITDTEYTNGGIRFSASNTSQSSEVYFDSVDVIQRNSSDLDRIGAMFGELGERRARTDDEYAKFLRSIVQSFSGRGTVDGIKFAVASALDLPPDQIVIEEDFVNNEYEVSIEVPFPPHEVRTLNELADLADPSGVNFGSINYGFENQEVEIDDTVSVSEGTVLSEEFGADDAVIVNANNVSQTEEMVVDDSVAVNRRATSDDIGSTVSVTVNANKIVASDAVTADDAVAQETGEVNNFYWEQDNWDFMEWTEIIDIGPITATEESGFTVTVTVDPNQTTVSDGVSVGDSVNVKQNPIQTSDTMFSDDGATVDADRTTASDGMASSESVATAQTLVAWDTNDWDTLEWVQEHN